MSSSWESEKILKTAEDLSYDISTLTKSEIEVKYKEFKEKFEKLYNAILNPNFFFDPEELKKLLEFRDKAKEDNTPDFIRDVMIGEAFAKKYIYPKTGEPSLKDKKEAAKKILNKHPNLANN